MVDRSKYFKVQSTWYNPGEHKVIYTYEEGYSLSDYVNEGNSEGIAHIPAPGGVNEVIPETGGRG